MNHIKVALMKGIVIYVLIKEEAPIKADTS
jgi:hypothetical protein